MRNSIKQREAVRAYRTGRKMSDETKEKLSKALKGRKAWNKGLTKEDPRVAKYSLVKVGKKRPDIAKENNPAWKGGITEINKMERVRFRKLVQKLVLKRDKFTCQLCGSKKDLQVDHIQSWAEYEDLRFSMSNCRTICANCHYQITFGKPMPENIRGWGHHLLKGVS